MAKKTTRLSKTRGDECGKKFEKGLGAKGGCNSLSELLKLLGGDKNDKSSDNPLEEISEQVKKSAKKQTEK